MPLRCSVWINAFVNSCHSLSLCVPGWPGAHNSVDICEGLQEWSGGQDAFHPSDTEEEALVQLVSQSVEEVLRSSNTIVYKEEILCPLYQCNTTRINTITALDKLDTFLFWRMSWELLVTWHGSYWKKSGLKRQSNREYSRILIKV